MPAFILHFSILNMLKMTHYFRKCEVALFIACYRENLSQNEKNALHPNAAYLNS